MARYKVKFSYGHDKQYKDVVDYLLEGNFGLTAEYNPEKESIITFECSERTFEKINRYWLPKGCQVTQESK